MPLEGLATPKSAVHLAFCCDGDYIRPLCVALRSVLRTALHPSQLHFWILAYNLSAEYWEVLGQMVEMAGACLHALSLGGREDVLSRAPTSGYISLASYYRLLLPDLVAPEMNRLLYLDCDLIVRRPVEELYTQDLQGQPLAAVRKPDPGPQDHLGLPSSDDYFNAGVLLLDLDLWRRERIHHAALAYIGANPGTLTFHDQDALNHVIAGRWARLDARWNQQFRFYTQSASHIGIGRTELRQIRADPFIVHYTTSSKPWHADNAHPYRREFYRILDETDFAGWRPAPAQLSRRLRCYLKRLIPAWAWPRVMRNNYRGKYHAIKRRVAALF